MTLPSVIQYASPEVRETFEALAKQKDFLEQRVLRAEARLREARDDERRAANAVKEVEQRLVKFERAFAAAEGTPAAARYARGLREGKHALATYQERLEVMRERVAEAEPPQSEARAARDEVVAKMAAIAEVG